MFKWYWISLEDQYQISFPMIHYTGHDDKSPQTLWTCCFSQLWKKPLKYVIRTLTEWCLVLWEWVVAPVIPSHHSPPCNHSPCQCGHLVRGLHWVINTTLHWYTPSLYQTTLQHQITSNYNTHHYIPAHCNTPQFCTLHCITLHTICLLNTSLIYTTLLTRADLGVLSTQQSESGR